MKLTINELKNMIRATIREAIAQKTATLADMDITKEFVDLFKSDVNEAMSNLRTKLGGMSLNKIKVIITNK